MTFLSLFSGIGGLDLGLERAGLRCVGQVEINEFCRRVLAKHWPTVRRHDDVRTLTDGNPDDWRADVVAGGFPCKQTSRAAAIHGRRVGLRGGDSGLWYAMLDIVRWVNPRYVVVENPASEWLAEVQRGLEEVGYRTEKLDRSAAGAGAPHLRRRVFVVANRHQSGLPLAGPSRPPADDGEQGRGTDRNAWLSSLPGVVRVDDGVPGGLDRRERITAIGNAVVPAVGEQVGKLLLQMAQATTEYTHGQSETGD